MTSQIGSHLLINISSVPTAPQQDIVIESQAGVTGVMAWLTGVQGQKSSFTSVVDCTSLAAALATLAQYQLYPGLGPQLVKYGGVQLPFYIKILEVKPVEVRQIVLGVGGINSTSAAILRAQWQVISWVT
jgi:hypothetical protein